MPWFPNPSGGPPIQADTNPNPAGGSYGYYSDPGYSGPPPSTGGGSTPSGPSAPSTPPSTSNLGASIDRLLQAQAAGDAKALAETIREFDQKYGLDQQQFAESVRQYNQNYLISQAGLTGTYNGQQTQQAQLQAFNEALQTAGLYGSANPYAGFAASNPQARALIAQNPSLADPQYQQQLLQQRGYVFYPGENLQTLAAQQQAYNQQFGMVQLASTLQANPFRQAQVLGQANRILGGQPSASFQAPNTVAGVGTAGGNQQGGMGYLQQILDDIKDPTPNQTTASQFLAQTPTPNKINSADFLRSAPSTQNIVLQAMNEKYGIDPNDALAQIRNTLPQFNAPSTVGTVRR